MRLTLRTLLAYLDNTLEPRDAEALRQKIAESGFATQLVQRIRTTVSRNVLPAPTPHGVGPLDDPNVMGEFLDSTLPAEQVAEIERACLESDPLLAEAAACHQILTVILAQPAEVSEQLRQRVYDLPNRENSDTPAAGSFSALTIPPPGDTADPIAGSTRESATAGATAETAMPSAAAVPNRSAVEPVGVTDSGVSDAPTRLRQAEAERSRKRDSAIAGSKPRPVDDTRIYGGSIRPSRITPWLVSLALVAVLLFALYQIFEPILDRSQQVAQETSERLIDDDSSPPSNDSAEASAADSGATTVEDDIESQLGADRVESPESTPEVDDVIVPTDGPDVTMTDGTEDARRDDQTTNTDTDASEIIESDGAPPPPPGVDPTDLESSPPTESPAIRDVAGANTARSPDGVPPKDSPEVTDVAPPIPPSMESEERLPGDPAAVTEAKDGTPEEPTDDEAMAEEANRASIVVAKVASEGTLLIARDDAAWVRLVVDSDVHADQTFVVPPGFRVKMVMSKTEWTFSGPAKGKWITDEAGSATFNLDYGSLIIDPIEPETTVSLNVGKEKLDLAFGDVDARAAVQVEFDRQPGLDPLVVENRIASIEVYAIGGSFQLISNTDTMQIPDGQKWVRQGTAIPDLQTVESPPTWLEPAGRGQPSLQALARDGLLALIRDTDSLQIALREATLFRRAEVAALAAQTLLQLGFGDIYFGGDGILGEIKQRIYWPEHYKSLKAHVNHSAESAAALRDSIAKMDSANATAIFRLLTGFSQRQLIEGADQQLVAMLDSPSTAVRVLALENLREITGTTLNFRPEEDNDVRRAPGVKKWEVRQRKGDIRWQP